MADFDIRRTVEACRKPVVYTRWTCPDRETLHTQLDPWYESPRIDGKPAGLEHEQKQCPTCGLWAIWQLKTKA